MKKNCEGGEASIPTQNFEGYESFEVLVVSSNLVEGEWIPDSGCFYHMSRHREWFTNFRREHESVLLGDNKACQISRSGSILLQMVDNCSRTISNVRCP